MSLLNQLMREKQSTMHGEGVSAPTSTHGATAKKKEGIKLLSHQSLHNIKIFIFKFDQMSYLFSLFKK